MDGKLIAERGKTKGEAARREGAGAGGYGSGGQMDGKRCSGALRRAPGQRRKWAQLKTNTCLLTLPLSRLVKASGSVFVLALSPASASAATASPGRDAGGSGGTGGHDGSKQEVGVSFVSAPPRPRLLPKPSGRAGFSRCLAAITPPPPARPRRRALAKHSGFRASDYPPFPAPEPRLLFPGAGD